MIKNKYDHIDILINNAGLFVHKFILTPDKIETTFQLNHISPLFLSALLLDLISKSKDGRIINVSSNSYLFSNVTEEYLNFDEKGFSLSKSYPNSKLGNFYLTYALNRYCEKNKLNVKSACLHPGFVITEMGKPHEKPWYYQVFFYLIFLPIAMVFAKNELVGAQTTLHLCYIKKEDFVNDAYYDDCKVKKTVKNGINKELEGKYNNITRNYLKRSQIYDEIDKKENSTMVNFIDDLKNEIE